MVPYRGNGPQNSSPRGGCKMRAKSHPAAHSRCSGHTVGPPVAAAYRHGPGSQGPGLKGEPDLGGWSLPFSASKAFGKQLETQQRGKWNTGAFWTGFFLKKQSYLPAHTECCLSYHRAARPKTADLQFSLIHHHCLPWWQKPSQPLRLHVRAGLP